MVQAYDGGNRWWKAENLPISQFYHVSLDDRDPYKVYGGLQDNSWVGDSAYPGGITNSRWENMYGGDGFWMFNDPSTRITCTPSTRAATLARVNRWTHQARARSSRWPARAKLRYNWNTPLAPVAEREGHAVHRRAVPVPHPRPRPDLGPHLAGPDDQRPGQAAAGEVGRRDRRQLGGGDAHDDLLDQRVAEAAGTIWVGTDDGNVQLTRDGGKTGQQRLGAAEGQGRAAEELVGQLGRGEPPRRRRPPTRRSTGTFGDFARMPGT